MCWFRVCRVRGGRFGSNTQQASRRRQLPFGEPRGTAPTAWPGERGFVGGTIDTSTGLTHIGAREYDPALGRFVSVDPIMDLTDPQQMHGYTYSNNNPVTFSDPTGLKIYIDNDHWVDSGACRDGNCGGNVPPTPVSPGNGANDYLDSPVLGQDLPDNTYDTLKGKGYKGSKSFTRREALEFAQLGAEQASVACQALAKADGTSWQHCKTDAWNWDGAWRCWEPLPSSPTR